MTWTNAVTCLPVLHEERVIYIALLVRSWRKQLDPEIYTVLHLSVLGYVYHIYLYELYIQIDIYVFILSKKYFQRNLISIQYKLQSEIQTIYMTFVIFCN